MKKAFARVFGAQPSLPTAKLVAVETDTSRGLHAFSIVGLPDKAVEEARDRIASAIKNSDFISPKSTNKKIVISLAPAELRKEGSAFDVPLALSYLSAVGDIVFDQTDKIFAGELALDGSIRPIRGALSIALLARQEGFAQIYIPFDNISEVSLVPGITSYPVRNLRELIDHLQSPGSQIAPTQHFKQQYTDITKESGSETSLASLGDIRGQESAKRGMEIAAAGRHNIALYGPPGTGKTMLARAVSRILPALSEEEIIEVTTIHSFAGILLKKAVVVTPPFRAPHHTASYPSIVGGGTIPRPGEVTLAHRGVLFLDEFPEFDKEVINALREPLEDGHVSINRVRGKALFPANFMLIAALNPCPCGMLGTSRCVCNNATLERYRRKISGPIIDRIDMWVHVSEVAPEVLAGARSNATPYENVLVRERIKTARDTQSHRFINTAHIHTNADMGPKEIETLAQIVPEAESTLVAAARTMKLSARGYHRTIKLARTIADLACSDVIEPQHILDALQYRPKTDF